MVGGGWSGGGREVPLLGGGAVAVPDAHLQAVGGVGVGDSRQRPELGLTRVPPVACRCWAAVPLHSHNWTGVPLAVPELETSRHLPTTRRVSPVGVQFWAALPLQSHREILLPLVVAEEEESSRHFALFRPEVMGPDPVPGPVAWTSSS
ncbi:hypothetical protein GCM10023235_78050 [Kitasatospora terrestris]|uniref:Uncharacterized protein n=1 Tax=Kitasatospora terrestris TaxID=258051 RepID=A0ABP9ETT6_9ACTN